MHNPVSLSQKTDAKLLPQKMHNPVSLSRKTDAKCSLIKL